MKVIENRTISTLVDHDGQTVADFEINRCTFHSAGVISRSGSPLRCPLIRNVCLTDCTFQSSYLDGAIVENVRVHNLHRRNAPMFLRANAYRHVILSGRIGALEIRGKFGVMDDSHDAEWDQVNSEYYRTVDWALDISSARFASCSISGIPTELIRRDTTTTAVVTRHRALSDDWRRLTFRCGVFHVVLGCLVDEGYDDVLLIACRGSSRFADQLKDLEMLRSEGVAV